MATMGFFEMMIIMMGGGLFSGAGLMGLPPGERDAALINCPPKDALVYVEWAERSQGKPGAQGIDGLAADPEIRLFIRNVDRAVTAAIKEGTTNEDPGAQALGRALPPLIKTLLMRPGCVYAGLDAEAAKEALGREDAVPPGAGLAAGLSVTLVVNAGDQADEVAGHIDEILGFLVAEFGLKKSEGLKRQKLPLPVPGTSLTLHRHNSHFILGFGEGTIEAALAGLSGTSNGLTQNERFSSAVEKVSMKRTAQLTWIDVKNLVTEASAAMGLQGAMILGMARMTGADAIDSIASCTGVEAGQIRTRSFVDTGGRTDGVLALAAGRAIERADFSHVPNDADLVFAASLNADKILSSVREIISQAHPPSRQVFDESLQQLERELGLSVQDDLLAAFGDVWTLYNSPSSGGLLLTAPVLAIEVQDSQKAEKVLSQLMKVLKQTLPGEYGSQFRRRGVFLAEAEFLDRTIYYINTVGDDVPFAPSFCLTDKHLLLTLHPQAAKAHLRFLAGDEASFSSRLQGDLAIPADGELLSLTYCDPRAGVQALYALAPYFGQLIFAEIQSEGGEIDIFSLPSGRAILPYLSDSLSTVVRTEQGILLDGQSILPVPGGATALMNLPALFFFTLVDVAAPVPVNSLQDASGQRNAPRRQQIAGVSRRGFLLPKTDGSGSPKTSPMPAVPTARLARPVVRASLRAASNSASEGLRRTSPAAK